VIHECPYILVRTKLAPVSNRNSTQRTFFFALSIVCFDALTAKSMQTRFVDNWAVHHILTNWASQIFHDTSNKLYPDLVVNNEWSWHPKLVTLLIIFMAYSRPF